MKDFKISAIICAAGKGERAGFSKNKLLVPLFGAPALYHTLKKFSLKEISEVIVTSSEADFKEISALCAPFGYKVVRGGKTRTDSVKRALKQVTGDIVLIHDGARPFVSENLILNCIDSVKKFGSAVAAVKFTDTAVYAQYGEITDRPDRDGLYRVQTPQGFMTEDIINAYKLSGNNTYTDDSAVYGEFIAPPRLIEGEESNVKLTFKSDYPPEYPILSCSSGQRAGIGVDVHCFGEGSFVTLAGVKIPCDNGLIAHSDGDVIIHAVMDALLSAAGLKDIGNYFPDSDEKYKGADSITLLKEVVKTVLTAGYVPFNVSVTVQAEKPKLAPHIDKMIENISKACGITADHVAVAAGTCEHLGFVGEGLGIAAYCIATLTQI
ncbi:MAG: 2-C-methyl-D-erythritol 2,4-cyclodiphosphate synthase [Clostridia bacterium]|nr:2-C-methyl-D-erythritol 2,4-cyclodiphosphate synthase [Clostridia bacterium]